MVQPASNWLIGEHGRHQQAIWNRDLVLEAAREEPQAQPKEAQVAAILAMEVLHPAIAYSADAEIHDPEIGQARGNQQATEAGRIVQMALVQVKTATLLVREKGLDMRSFAIHLQGLIQVGDIRHELDRRIIHCLPDRQEANRPVVLSGDPGGSDGERFATYRL